MGFDRYLILGEESDALGPQEIALKLLQPEGAPTNRQASIAIDHAMPWNIRWTNGERPSHHACRDVRSAKRRNITVRRHTSARNAPHEAIDLGETSPSDLSRGRLAPPHTPLFTRSHDAAIRRAQE